MAINIEENNEAIETSSMPNSAEKRESSGIIDYQNIKSKNPELLEQMTDAIAAWDDEKLKT